MVNRFFFLLIILFIPLEIFAQNSLLQLQVEHNTLQLYFKKILKKSSFSTQVISTDKITKYIFDFKNCSLAKSAKGKKNLNGVIESIRVGQYKKDTVRVVIDSKRPYSLRFFQKKKPVFFIQLPQNSAIKSKESLASKKSAKKLFSKVNLLQNKNTQKPLESQIIHKSAIPKHHYKIVIDPGHGGKDPGTSWRGYQEKVLVLQIAKKVSKALKKLGFNVVMTRNSNRFISLGSRTRKANKENADIFVSIHANSIENKSRMNIARGVETYFLSTARTWRAKKVAAKENRAILQGQDSATKKMLLNAVFTGPKIVLSHKLAINVQSNILKKLRQGYSGIKDGGVRAAPFYVLVGAQMPAILIEVGYLSNPTERARLQSSNYQNRIANGIVQGIVEYLKNRERELE